MYIQAQEVFREVGGIYSLVGYEGGTQGSVSTCLVKNHGFFSGWKKYS